MKKRKKIIIILSIILVCLAVIILRPWKKTETVVFTQEPQPFYESSYKIYLDSHGYVHGITRSENYEIPIDIFNFEATSELNASVHENGVRTGDMGTISWNFNVQNSGFYNLAVSYIPEHGTNTQIKRIISLDGVVLHQGLRQSGFNRSFKNEKDIIDKKKGSEIRPRSVEIFRESTVFVGDSQKRSLDPFLFYLSRGMHTLTFESIKEPMRITGISFGPAPLIPSYSEYIAGIVSPPYRGKNLVFEAERTGGGTLGLRKSLPSINLNTNFFDPDLVPYHPYRITYNTIGGETWRFAGEAIEWDIYIPEEGLYKLSFKGRQGVKRGVISYRQLQINGVTPFIEAQNLEFAYSTSMVNYIPAGSDGNPWMFYFKKGLNTLSLETVLGSFGEPYSNINDSVMILNDLYRRIVQITGTVPDLFIDYEVSKKVPDYVPILNNEYKRLMKVVNDLNRITVEKGSNTTMIERVAEQFGRLLRRPDNITNELSQFRSNITGLATWMVTVSEMPLELDSFTLLSAKASPAPPMANFFKRAYNEIIRFFATFFVDFTSLDTEAKKSKDALRVWFPTGRDQAQVLRDLIDERFIPEYNIAVNLELVPGGVIIPSTLAGVGPDVVLGIDQGTLINFAVRNALVDISVLDGYEEEAAQYYPSAIEGITFLGKVFGLPETQGVSMVFYRKDIFDDLGILPPATWDDLRALIPVLHMNNYDVSIPGAGLMVPLIVQKGGVPYKGEGDDYGIETAFLEDIAMDSFKEVTDFYTAYKVPVAMDFNNRFRTGEVPLGIAGYTNYFGLELMAPEIRGLWSFAPFPGTIRPDGTFDRRVTTGTSQTVMLKGAVERGRVDKAWIFMRWWLSTEIQVAYSNSIEAILGPSMRHATAKREVLVQLPWAASDAKKILDQFEHTKGFPPVPGDYMTDRMIGFAFANVVAGGANPREVLYLNNKDINLELSKKRKEFNLSYIDWGGR